MEVTPKTLREVEFREKMRGYHPEDVDHFLEEVAAGIESLHERLRHAQERAARAEQAAAEAGGSDDTLRKTLVLAQRTADMAVQEAREQAARILAAAEQQAQSMLAEAEERGRRTLEETIAECKAELEHLEGARSQSQQEVESLQRWIEEHKTHLTATLSEALAAVERAGMLWSPPTGGPLEAGRGGGEAVRRNAEPASSRLAPPALGPTDATSADGPETMAWSPGDGPLEQPSGAAEEDLADPDDQAFEDFFDGDGELEEEPRHGGRLRRRR